MLDAKGKIVAYLKEVGIARARDFSNLGVQREHLVRLVGDGTIVRTSRGVYRLSDAFVTEYGHFAEVAKRVPGGVVALLSALRFHDIGTQNPSEVWLAIKQRARKPNLDYPSLQVVWFSGAAFATGVNQHEIDGVQVSIYSPAKTVVDCFKYRNKIGIDVCVEALKDSLAKRLVDLNDLWHFASICRVSSVIRPYVEALL